MKSKTYNAEELTESALKASDLVVHKEIDQSAQTAQEFMGALGCGLTTAHRTIRTLLSEKKVEKVWKYVGGLPVPAYRVVATK
jgi:hypothetical protein